MHALGSFPQTVDISDVPFPSRVDATSARAQRFGCPASIPPALPVGCFLDSSQDEGLLLGDHEEHRILSDWQEPFQRFAGREVRVRTRTPGP